MIVRAYHAIITTYGFWLPNDPRGSWSDWVRQWELLQFGRATKVSTRRSVAGRPHDFHEREEAKKALRYPPVSLTGQQALAVGMGFRRAIEESGYAVYACSILPQHAHLVIARHEHRVEQIIGHLKGRATQQLAQDGLHPLADQREADGNVPSPWARKSWSVFLHADERIQAAIEYVEKNPSRRTSPNSGGPSSSRFGRGAMRSGRLSQWPALSEPSYHPITMFDSITLRARSRSLPVSCM